MASLLYVTIARHSGPHPPLHCFSQMSRLTLPKRLALWSRSSTPRGREIVLEILQKTHPVPIHSRDLFQRIRDEYPDEKMQPLPPDTPLIKVHRETSPSTGKDPVIPYPDHPIRSLRYLKDILMEDLIHRRQIKKVHTMREPTPEELQQKKSKNKGKKSKAFNKSLVSINVKGMVDQWGWILVTSKDVDTARQEEDRIKKAIEGQKSLDEKKVEKDIRVRFLEQWGHLNPRRQRARVEKLEREQKKATQLERVREEGRKELQVDSVA